jgi:hypothetical protein
MKKGDLVSKNFILDEQINSITDLLLVLQNEKSLFWRHRVHPTAFFLSWPLRLITQTLEGGHFWSIKKNSNQSNFK